MKVNPNDYIGKQFGKNIVIKFLGAKNRQNYWLCKCIECGYEKKVSTGNLKIQLGCQKCNERQSYRIGKKFNMLTVIEEVGKDKHGAKLYKCQCYCGNTTIVCGHHLGRTKSCGCLNYRKDLPVGTKINMRTLIEKIDNNTVKIRCDCGNEKIISYGDFLDKRSISCGCLKSQWKKTDITGKRFGMLVAIREVDTIKVKKDSKHTYYQHFWEFKCDCGNIVKINKSNVVSGKQISCGCHKRKIQNEIHKLTVFDKTNIHIQPSKLRHVGKSGVVGVYQIGNSNRYKAKISFQKRTYDLGTYDFENAKKIRKQAETKIHEPFIKWYEENKELIKKGKITHYHN